MRENMCVLIQIPSNLRFQEYVSIVLGNGLVLNRWQVITRTSDDQDVWRNMASLGHSELKYIIIITHTIPTLLCFVVVGYRLFTSISSLIFSQPLSQLRDCPRASAKILNNMGKWWGSLLLKRGNCNPGMDKWSHAQESVGYNYLFIPKLQRCNRWSLGMDK